MSAAEAAGPDVSVIVPVFNTERFLGQALESIAQNDRCDLEVIVLNDGSTDGSLAIMRTKAEKDPRFRVVDKPNEGYGATVNRGIAEARGAYIAIVEPDDWVDAHMYDDLVDKLQEVSPDLWSSDAPDVLKGAYWRIQQSGTSCEKRLHCAYHGRGLAKRPYPLRLTDAPELVRFHPSIWSALYKRSFLDREGIRFREAPGAGWVDNPWLLETLGRARSILYVDTPYYNYREDLPGASSATISAKVALERWNQMMDEAERLGLGQDPGVMASLTTVGLTHVAAIARDGGLDQPAVRERVQQVFDRMDATLIRNEASVSPGVRRMALSAKGEGTQGISSLGHLAAMAREFGHGLVDNGPAFALDRVAVFFRRARQQASGL